MAGMSALRGGAGLVRLAIPDCCLETVAAFSPCAMTIPLPADSAGRLGAAAIDALAPCLAKATCVALGPGLGQSRELQIFVSRLLRRITVPMVIDADGLNCLSDVKEWMRHLAMPLVITPHPGEWARLSGVPATDRTAQSLAAVEFARNHQMVVVLKGHRTLITDGESVVWNTTGTPAMATGGSGDVLTGLITALICQGLKPRDAAHLAVHAHGLAGQIAERELQSHVVLPTELIDFLPRAFRSLSDQRQT